MLSKVLLTLAFLAAFAPVNARVTKSHKLSDYTFEQYLLESGKKYDGADYDIRREYFNHNLKAIQRHNANPSATYSLGVNMFTDRSPEELARTFGGNKHALARTEALKAPPPAKERSASERAALLASLPHSKDWRTEGVVTPVKDQVVNERICLYSLV